MTEFEVSAMIKAHREGKNFDEVLSTIEGARNALNVAKRIITEAGIADDMLLIWGVNSDSDIIKFAEFIEEGMQPKEMLFYEWFNRSTFKFNELENLGINTVEELNKALWDFERFGDDALEHIFKGNINNNNKLTGYHYENYPNAIARVKTITRQPNDFGVYEAKVETITGGIVKEELSTFFPKEWTPKQVMDAIMEAYCDRIPADAGWWVGTTKSGMVIKMGIKAGSDPFKVPQIVTAYPIY